MTSVYSERRELTGRKGSPWSLTAVLLLITEHLGDSVSNVILGELDVVLGVAGLIHEGQEVVIGDIQLSATCQSICSNLRLRGGKTTHQLVLLTGDVGDVHVVGGGRQIFVLLAGEDVKSDQVDLGVTVLASLGGGHIDDLAGTSLDDNVTVLPQSRALHGEGGGGTGIRRVESLLHLSTKLAIMTRGLIPSRDI